MEEVRLIAIPTWRCNLKCSYCAYRVRKDGIIDIYHGLSTKALKEISPKHWILFFNSFSNALVEFTGGEPLLYNGLSEVVDSLSSKHKWAITSNTTLPNVVFNINPKRCKTWTASFHFESPKPFSDIEYFIDFLKQMREYGYQKIASTIVYLPWLHTEKDINFYISKFEEAKIPLNWHPYHFYKYKWSPHKIQIAKRLSPWFKPEWESYGISKICNAGQKYFVVDCDGTVYPCYSHMIFDSLRLGNIKEKWSPLKKKLNCENPCVFPCDYLTNKIKYVESNSL